MSSEIELTRRWHFRQKRILNGFGSFISTHKITWKFGILCNYIFDNFIDYFILL